MWISVYVCVCVYACSRQVHNWLKTFRRWIKIKKKINEITRLVGQWQKKRIFLQKISSNSNHFFSSYVKRVCVWMCHCISCVSLSIYQITLFSSKNRINTLVVFLFHILYKNISIIHHKKNVCRVVVAHTWTYFYYPKGMYIAIR